VFPAKPEGRSQRLDAAWIGATAGPRRTAPGGRPDRSGPSEVAGALFSAPPAPSTVRMFDPPPYFSSSLIAGMSSVVRGEPRKRRRAGAIDAEQIAGCRSVYPQRLGQARVWNRPPALEQWLPQESR